MADPDGLFALAADLRALAPRQRSAVLASLTGFERARVRALLESSLEEEKPDAYASLSPWLAERFRQAASGDAAAHLLTPATASLMTSVTAASAAAAPGPAEPAPPPRTLFGVIAGLLGARRAGG